MIERKKIYLASPLGFYEAGKDWMYAKLIPTIEAAGCIVIDPWKLTPKEEIDRILGMPCGIERILAFRRQNARIGKRNANAIRIADGIFAVLDGSDVDSGVAAEIGFGAALSKPILGYRNDFRPSRENEGTIVNLQVEYFLGLHKGKIITSLKEIKDGIRWMFKSTLLS